MGKPSSTGSTARCAPAGLTRTSWSSSCSTYLLHQDEVDLRHLTLTERKQDLVKPSRKSILSRMKLIQTFPEGDVLFEHCARFGFEGIVAKRLDRPYVSGPSRSWVKVPRMEA